MLNQNSLKFILRFLFVLSIALVVWAVAIYFDSDAREEREALRYWEDLKEEYENDTFGGETPEETLTLFIEALEAEDIELASRYFPPDDREEIRQYLSELYEEDDWDLIIRDAENLKLTTLKRDIAFYTITDDNNVVVVQVVMNKNSNNIWKISDI